ncbi:MAG: discoidin domain-containing protein [Myxococcales bacterium]|nr:discoidin domain-containing protein [Myxococcales bacterium]
MATRPEPWGSAPIRCVAAALLLLLALVGVARAEPACPDGNLLAGKTPVAQGVTFAPRIVDGVAPVDGDPWNTALTAILTSNKSTVTWDLGQETRLGALLLQGDNNDTYDVSISTDGSVFQPLWTAPEVGAPGMQTRLHQGFDATARYLRIGNAAGDNAYSLGEVMAFCRQPAAWPPSLTRKAAEVATITTDRKHRMAFGKMTFGLLALLIFLGLAVARIEPGPRTRGAVTAWAILAAAAFIGLDKLRFAEPSVAAVGHFAAAAVLLWRLNLPAPKLKLVGHAIAGLGALALILFSGLRIQGELGAGAANAPILAHLHWIALGVAGALLAFGWWRRADARPFTRSVERVALLAIVAAASVTWTNYLTFHGSRAVHYWDSFHYYMGSKYFKETRYHLLYHCSAIGEVDDGREAEFKGRQLRDLRDNTLGPAAPALADDGECRKNFTPERWAAFRQDLRLFRKMMGDAWWQKMFKDHGYNASPVWTMVGTVFADWDWQAHIPAAGREYSPANLRGKNAAERRDLLTDFNQAQLPAFTDRIERLALLDAALYIGIFVLIWWAFGLHICALAMAILATGYPWAYFWTGGGYGRVPWLFMAVAGVCFLKRGWRVAGGFAVTWAALLRVFPGGLAGGVALKVLYNLIRKRTVIPNHRRIILGAVLGVAVLVPASLPANDGFGAYKEFLENSMKHRDTPLTNHMGLPALVAFHPKLIARYTKNDRLDDPFLVWKTKRKETVEQRKWLYRGLILGLLVLVLAAGRRMEDWETTAISSLLIIGLFDLTCYYYNFIVLWAATGMRHTRYLVALMLMAVTSQVIQLLDGWYDTQYQWESLLVLGTLLYITGDFVWRNRKTPDLIEGEVPAPTA